MKSWIAIASLLLFASLAGPIQAASPEVGSGISSLPALIVVDTNRRYQRFDGFGGDYASGRLRFTSSNRCQTH